MTTRPLRITVDLTVEDDAEDLAVADAVFDALHEAAEVGVLDADGVKLRSIDGTDPVRPRS